jgi:plastocyanin
MAKPLALIAVAMLFLAMACGFTTPPAVPTPKPTVPQLPPGAVVENVDIKNFKHQDIEIKPATTVVWTNQDDTLHTIKHIAERQDEERLWASWPVAKGERYHYTFDTPGTFKYICELHPQFMLATVTVTE